ncbi:MAG: exodeoxyribonuclease V subunit alpha [Gammaproteobacteria bacterium]|nr:exodeoxyribonuclease V subunit alpha [Gammaproteobacteria bacterium]
MTAPPDILALRDQGLVGELDYHFANVLCRISAKPSPELALAAALTSKATAEGHICLDLAQIAGSALGASGLILAPRWENWVRQLRASGLVGGPGEFFPLVLDCQGRLYLHRYWAYQDQVARELRRRGLQVMDGVDRKRLGNGLDKLFPQAAKTGVDWQKIAAATAILRNLTIISGGPGTGKTRTVARVLALLRQQTGDAPYQIILSAPTGKAAARLEDSFQRACQALNLDGSAILGGTGRATTIHRLLGARPGSASFRHHRDNPLPVDVLVIDETSMVDVALMSKVLDALPSRSRLLLLGDHNQLASVEAGAVLGDICAGATGFTGGFAEDLSTLLGSQIPSSPAPRSDLTNAVVMLRHSYRFGADSGIDKVAKLANKGDVAGCLAQLRSPSSHDVQWFEREDDPLSLAISGYRAYAEAVASAASPGEVFRAFDEFRVLTTHRQGRRGADGMNQAIGERLSSQGLLDCRHRWFLGRPVMIHRNDYNLHLYNGDIGIVLVDDQGRERVCFPGLNGGFRWFSPARIPEQSTAFAMTVHKSQGSEFDRVLLVLPDQDSPLLSRELVYTAITRARSSVQISGIEEVLALAIQRRLARSSGLRDALWGDT